MKKVIAGILVALVLVVTLGTAALAGAPDNPTPLNSSCASHCATYYGGETMASLAQSPGGLSGIAQMTDIPCGPCCPPES